MFSSLNTGGASCSNTNLSGPSVGLFRGVDDRLVPCVGMTTDAGTSVSLRAEARDRLQLAVRQLVGMPCVLVACWLPPRPFISQMTGSAVYGLPYSSVMSAPRP
jgi:hypothetical protein